ncbi:MULTISPECIES: 5-carboxymethyl-2-hydroxymuconate Delta-isomerase [Ferrimonas]|uniref:5-carboxymethyl-2-hydroxymuconate Delta-isomerase n=1 Tax=Ferrimonas TaxID=44011 RepID=UPI0003F4BD85|nr:MULTISPECIES: 5-carboxymethyl-2-hydroxymuconate Delta-isomerase [Ferrimonas]USD35841.1 5-carboxymethyl-2-hydroxymuconate Delta-isomerase [Ferrimonas sp. SCSIO 43195]
MPHFVMDCSAEVLHHYDEASVLVDLHRVAVDSGLFNEADIKVRVRPFSSGLVGGSDATFIHVFASIMSGRSTEQKAALSRAVVSLLSQRYPEVANIAMNVSEFEKASYCNRRMLT